MERNEREAREPGLHTEAAPDRRGGTAPQLAVERVQALGDSEVAELAEAAAAAIMDGGGFGWVKPQPRDTLARYFRGATTRRRPSRRS